MQPLCSTVPLSVQGVKRCPPRRFAVSFSGDKLNCCLGPLPDPSTGLSAPLASHGWTIHKAAVPLAMQPLCSTVPLSVQGVKRCPPRRFAVSFSGDKLNCCLGPLPDPSTGLSAPLASHGWTIHKAAVNKQELKATLTKKTQSLQCQPRNYSNSMPISISVI